MITYKFDKETNSLYFYDGEMLVAQNSPYCDEESALEYAPRKVAKLNAKFGYSEQSENNG